MYKPDFAKGGGILPAIAQDSTSNEVLMLAWMNEEAWKLTIETGFAHYFSRSRNRLWKKGESSGHLQTIKEIRVDCDEDTILLLVEQHGAACHEGFGSCFFRRVNNSELETCAERIVDPDDVYKK